MRTFPFQYYKCTSVGNDTSLAWKLKQCKVGLSFNDYAKSCQQDFTCAIKKSCLLGSSFSISCRKYMYCTGERYEKWF
uniref:Chitin-binding type-2 domain-containing protein n=1 Tax=Heterorhabditis bacteriophora TaxID=37862 RepID=A0A1I7W844_HETBA